MSAITSFEILDAAREHGVPMALHTAEKWAGWLNAKPEAIRWTTLEAWLLDEADTALMAQGPELRL